MRSDNDPLPVVGISRSLCFSIKRAAGVGDAGRVDVEVAPAAIVLYSLCRMLPLSQVSAPEAASPSAVVPEPTYSLL